MKMTTRTILAAAISSAMTLTTPAFANGAATLTDALKNGDVVLGFRLRYEDVSVASPSAAKAVNDLASLRTRLTYTSLDYQGFGLGVEMDDVSYINAYQNENKGADIADPKGTEVNQYFLTYKVGKTVAKYGRQRIILDNQRFVGGVGFRQNEQTYDGFSLLSNDVDKVTLFGAYVTNVNRIFGENNANPDLRDNHGDIVLLNAQYKVVPAFGFSAYLYDIQNDTVKNASNKTLGLRTTGTAAGFTYVAEYATQSESGDSALNYSADYTALEGGYAYKIFSGKIGYEVLGADGTNGQFITPLATLHAFQGWTDLFLNGGLGNGAGGLTDAYAQLGVKAGPVNLTAVYHDIGYDDDSLVTPAKNMEGDELGFVVAGAVKGIALSAKYAEFNPDSTLKGDVRKLWVTAEATF
jgi:hypothetical protein